MGTLLTSGAFPRSPPSQIWPDENSGALCSRCLRMAMRYNFSHLYTQGATNSMPPTPRSTTTPHPPHNPKPQQQQQHLNQQPQHTPKTHAPQPPPHHPPLHTHHHSQLLLGDQVIQNTTETPQTAKQPTC
eukprot:GHVN01025284.1.p1 GENE.GHVN01025284.1~~GHVN01025284.1.p1  ORF type:complete len:138 (-),score=35.11 GHVN01025284.1:79-468(-)